MRGILSFLQRNAVAAFSLLAIGVLFSSCLKNDDNKAPDIPAAGLMAFNLANDQQSVVIRLSGSSLTQNPLAYTNYTGLYQQIYTGQRTVESYDYPETTPLTSTPFNFVQDKFYSVFVVGYNNKYRNVVVEDSVGSLANNSGKAFVRYINAIADSTATPLVTLAAAGTNLFNDNAAYGQVSDFKEVAAGDVSVAVKDNDNIDASRTITLQQNKVYTVLLLGVPGDATEAKKVQIRFVENGTVTEDK